MPPKSVCNKIKDPVARKKCLAYKGKYAKDQPEPATNPGAGYGKRTKAPGKSMAEQHRSRRGK